MLKVLLVGTTLLTLVSCGGNSSGGNSETSISSQFIDAPVKGLNIVKASGDTTTQDGGRFNCVPGEAVGFFLRDLNLGVAPCGSRIFVNDIAEENTAYGIAALLQSLSVTDYSGENGVIDLSAIPATASVKNVISNLSDANAVLTQVNNVRSLATEPLKDAPADVAAVRAHVASSVSRYSPADSNLKTIIGNETIKTIPVKATYVSGCSNTEDEKCDCYTSGTANLVLEKIGTEAVAAQLKDIQVCESENTCYNDVTSNKKIITSSSFSLNDVTNFQFTINDGMMMFTNSATKETGHVCYGKDIDSNEEFTTDCYKENGKFYYASPEGSQSPNEILGVLPLEDNGRYPFTITSSLATNVTLSGTNASPVVNGTMTERGTDFHVSDYTGAQSYAVVRDEYSCVYKVENQ